MFKRFWWLFPVMLPVGALSGLFVAAVVTYVMPKKYESECMIEVKPLAASRLPTADHGAPPEPSRFPATECETIQSRNVLEKVVADLELANRWGEDKESALRKLKPLVTASNVRGTDLISIRVLHTNKMDAKDIANQLAAAYGDYRISADKQARDSSLALLELSIKEQAAKVAKSSEDFRGYMGGLGKGGMDLAEAKRRLEEERNSLADLEKTRDALKLAVIDGIAIHEHAVTAVEPCSPKVTFNLLLGTGIGLILSPFLALPLIWLLSRAIPSVPAPHSVA